MTQPIPMQQEIQIPYSQGVLTGMLMIPSLRGQHPAVVLLAGSGSADRNVSYLLPVREHLVQHGIATLVFDKPGLGGSTGDWRHQTFYDRVEQARAAVTYLQQRAEINPRQIGFYGISQGAWISLLAAATYPEIPFIIPISGPGMMPVDQDVYYIEHVLRAEGHSESQIQQAVRYVQDVLRAAYRDAQYSEVTAKILPAVQHEPWYPYYAIPDVDMWEYFRRNAKLNYDPLTWLTNVKCPVLAMFGAEDLLLPVETSVAVYQDCLAKAGNKDVTIKVFANAGHLITVPPADELAPGFLESIIDWLVRRVEIVRTR